MTQVITYSIYGRHVDPLGNPYHMVYNTGFTDLDAAKRQVISLNRQAGRGNNRVAYVLYQETKEMTEVNVDLDEVIPAGNNLGPMQIGPGGVNFVDDIDFDDDEGDW